MHQYDEGNEFQVNSLHLLVEMFLIRFTQETKRLQRLAPSKQWYLLLIAVSSNLTDKLITDKSSR